MTRILVDTSALMAALNAGDEHHERAKDIRHALAFDSDFEQRGFGLPWT